MGRTPYATYPTHHLFAILDTDEQIQATIEDLHTNGFEDEDIAVYTGDRGADYLDASGRRHGLFARLLRSFEFITTDAITDTAEYEQAAMAGRYVVSVKASHKVERDRAHAVVRDHGGHLINYYGRMATTAFDH